MNGIAEIQNMITTKPQAVRSALDLFGYPNAPVTVENVVAALQVDLVGFGEALYDAYYADQSSFAAAGIGAAAAGAWPFIQRIGNSLFGAGSQQEPAPEPKKDNTTLFVMAGIGVVALVAIILIFKK